MTILNPFKATLIKVPVNTIFNVDQTTNSYILKCSKKYAAIIDPAGNATEIKKILEELKVTPKYLLITHGHLDHWIGIEDLIEKYPYVKFKLWIHKDDMILMEYDSLLDYIGKYYKKVKKQRSNDENDHEEMSGREKEEIETIKALFFRVFYNRDYIKRVSNKVRKLKIKKWKDEQKLNFKKVKFNVLLTKGHSLGSVTLYTNNIIDFDEKECKKIAFLGDLVQNRRIGLTFDINDKKTLWNTIITKILSRKFIDESYILLPGHGNQITFLDIRIGLLISIFSARRDNLIR